MLSVTPRGHIEVTLMTASIIDYTVKTNILQGLFEKALYLTFIDHAMYDKSTVEWETHFNGLQYPP